MALTAVQPVKTMPSHGGISDLGGSVSLLQAEGGCSAAHLNGNMAFKGFKEQVFLGWRFHGVCVQWLCL